MDRPIKILLLMEGILHHLGCITVWNPVNHGINYQPQLVLDFWTINSMISMASNFQVENLSPPVPRVMPISRISVQASTRIRSWITWVSGSTTYPLSFSPLRWQPRRMPHFCKAVVKNQSKKKALALELILLDCLHRLCLGFWNISLFFCFLGGQR